MRALHPATVALGRRRAAGRGAAGERDAGAGRAAARAAPAAPARARRAGLLVTATGRILAAGTAGLRGRRVAVPEPGGTLTLPDGRVAVAEPLGEAFLLRATGRAAPPRAGEADGPLLTLSLLGDGPPHALLDGRRSDLTLRHAEILALLALHPRGLSGDRLALYLYGDDGSPATVRPEIHRLRQQLGDIVRARPYRLGRAVEADFLTVRRLLDEGDVAGAVRLYGASCCPARTRPRSAPNATSWRCGCGGRPSTGRRRRAVDLRADRAGPHRPGGLERLRTVLPAGDPRRATVASRSDRLLSGDP